MSEEGRLFERLKNSVFTVYSDFGMGSGFLVHREGLIVTNAHVVPRSTHVRVQLNDSTKVAAYVVVSDKAADVAILRIHPDVCSHVVPLALPKSFQDFALVGEKVFAIGSPLNQDRILTTGVVSKIEPDAILSDVNINPGNSGGPLLNLDAEVIAVNTFRIGSEPGLAGSISAKLLVKPLNEALEKIRSLAPPAPTRYPVMPRGLFPFHQLRAVAAAKTWDMDAYSPTKRLPTEDFEVCVYTPPVLYRIEKAREVALGRKWASRASTTGQNGGAYDPFDDLMSWTQYDGRYAPAVMVQVIPKVGQTAESVFGNVLGAIATGLTGKPTYTHSEYEFKGDLAEFALFRNGHAAPECQRTYLWMPLDFVAGGWYSSASGFDLARAGLFWYDPRLFAPEDGRWPTIELVMRSSDKKKAFRYPMSRETVERVAKDFEIYWWLEKGRMARKVVGGPSGRPTEARNDS